MKEFQNSEIIEKEKEDYQKKFQNSELLAISNKLNEVNEVNDLNQINNLHNETMNQINLTTSNNIDYKISDKLYGNNYINYYLDNNHSYFKCFNSKIKKMGNLKVFCFINDNPLIVLGDKKKSLIFIYEVILHISFIILYATIFKSIPFYMKWILILIYINCFLCHMFIYLFNPGIPSIDHFLKNFLKSEKYMKMTEEKKKFYYTCEICNIIFKYTECIEHCEECDICVKKYDHHCFWTGKCITKKNILAFYFFSFGSMAYILWYFTIIIYWIISQTN
jgi:hypothetical protein